MKARLTVLLVALTLLGCGDIKSSSRLSQEVHKPLVAGIGDTIIEIHTRESMPNVFGKADIWGRTRPTGKVYVTYLGLEQGRAAFERHTIRIQSNATTMNSSPIIIPRSSTTRFYGTGTGGTFSGTANTTAPPLILPPTGSRTQIIGTNRVRYYLDLRQKRKLLIAGNEILIEEATASSVKYRIRKLR